jgi:hypothetical protein
MMRFLLLILIIILLNLVKPSLIYKPNGKAREFGVGTGEDKYKKTLFTLPVVIMMMAIVVSTQTMSGKKST